MLDCDLVITTGAHGGFKNPEVIKAKQSGIPVWTQGEAVGEFMKGKIFKKDFEGISVAGCHGKTTTTAMIATILKKTDWTLVFNWNRQYSISWVLRTFWKRKFFCCRGRRICHGAEI